MAAWLSATGASHRNLLPHLPLICLSTVNSRPCPRIAPQSLNSSSQPLPLPGDPRSCLTYVWLGKDCLILIQFRLPQISCFTLSLNCFSSDSDSCPSVGIRPLLQFPYLLRAGPVLLILLFPPLVPLSYWVLRGSIYSFPLVRSSCSLSWCFVCISVSEVYSWCIRGERCAPCPPTPLPSCSPCSLFLMTHLPWWLRQ